MQSQCHCASRGSSNEERKKSQGKDRGTQTTCRMLKIVVSCTKTWRQIKVNSFPGRDSVREEPKRIFGEWDLSARIAQKSSYTSKFQLGWNAIRCGALLSFCTGSTRCTMVGFVTVETGLLRLHYDSKNEHTHRYTQTHTRRTPPLNAKTNSSDNSSILDATSVFTGLCCN